ncbi:ABC transporter substrate-binding protein [Paractinoplanes abujensis]|uniref:Polar amino acid transport system substrate-binding protein n=1 Tax=Paractinoplanes abujensis TaxID=882441 RepID=A0A7W7CXX7_9ACTN|nr:ABC transporter substrate-binding protein [Actinoplanes abujensis]MBB4695570.1 polar amino acid transport system substrate-binding protein [Actinoplanes abujensis]GID23154.1 ABC transporter substrate-binding protein [Actinoplanes abujensis]
MKRVLLAAVLLAAVAGCAAPAGTAAVPTSDGGIAVDQALHDSLPESIRARGTIRFMTDASYAPMEQFAADGRTIIGFSPDLASALGSVLGVQAEMVQGDFHTALDDLAAGQYDGVLSSMNNTAERRKKADFVDYFTTGTAIIVQRGNPKGVTGFRSLCGLVVSTERGTVQADLLHRSQRACGANPMTIKLYKTNADALVELRTGRAAAVLNDFPPAAYLATDTRTKAFYQLASTTQYEPGLFGMAFAKNSPELRDAVQAAFDELVRTGVYTELLQRWGIGSGAITTGSVSGT